MEHPDGFTKEQRNAFFSISVSGPDLDVDAVLAEAPFDFDYVSRRDEQKRYSCIEGDLNTDSSMVKILGNPRQLLLHEQRSVATDFFREHHNYLKTLADRDDVEEICLGLSPTLEIERGVIMAALCLSRELVGWAGFLEMSVQLNVAPSVTEWVEEDSV